jgi:urease accessory protein
VRASARIVARCQPDGTTRLTTLAGEAPLLLRRTSPNRPPSGPASRTATHADGSGPDARPVASATVTELRRDNRRNIDAAPGPAQVHLVGGAAGPLGGDELRCSIDLGPGARLEVRGVAASVALPGPNGRESSLEILARIGEGAALSWSPQPLIAARGARHRTFTRVELAADARLVWRDELVLGRDGEEPGSLSTRLRVVRDGRVLLDREIAMGPRHPGSLGPAGSGGHRALGTVLIVDPAWEEADESSVTANAPGRTSRRPGMPHVTAQDDTGIAIAVMRLSGPAVLISAAATDAPSLARVLDSALG